jgi:hypothetical protein
MCFLYSRESRSAHISKWTVHLHFLSGSGSTLKCSICKKGTHVCVYVRYKYTHSIPGRCCYIKRTPRVSLAHSTDAAQDLFFTFTGGTCRARGPSTAQPTPKAHTPSPYSHTQHTSSSIASTLLNVNRVDCRRVDGRPPRSDPVFGHLAPPVGAPKCIQ